MPWDVVLTALVELRDEVNKLKRDRLPPAPMPCRVNEGASTSQGTQHNSSPVHNFTGFLDPICEAGVVTEQNFSDSVLMHNAKIFGPLDMVSEDIDQQVADIVNFLLTDGMRGLPSSAYLRRLDSSVGLSLISFLLFLFLVYILYCFLLLQIRLHSSFFLQFL
ncbi:hypothetical protein E2C01_022650 [Portunus trituberculatus]|uniref:Uncharacterized protein n=1 Tax=Portunus trituberculatus TaxID=210409 RepID=A0A5B7E5X0_PORTR|nr:hypothetical protein [Portunus trituberculatus]